MAKNDDNVTSSIEAYLDKIITDDINAAQVRSSKVYTELLASLSSSETLPVTLKSGEHRDREPREILELVESGKNIIISGASGSGKTKTLSWLNVTYAKKYKEDKNHCVPIYIELNTYNEGTFFDFVKIKVKEKGLNESALQLLLEKNSLILIDGLDLLSPSDYFRCYDNILNFISKYSDCRYVISSRPGYFDAFKRSQFKIFELEELTDEKMELFIEKYARDDKSIEFIKNKIFNEKFKSLYRNPLMLFLGIKVAKEIIDKKEAEKTDVFSTRSKLYEGFIDYLFYHHHREKGRILHANEVQIGETLKDIYFKLQCKNETICTYQNALDVAREHTKGYKETIPEKILDDVFELGLLFKNKTIVQYGIHQSFQEYFAALKLADLFKKGMDISPAFGHPKWDNVVIFASEMLESPDKLISSMIESDALFIASKCAGNASLGIKEELCALLAEGLDSMFEIEKTEAIRSIGRLGDTGLSLLIEALHDENDNLHRSAANALGELKSEKAVEPLIEALHDEDDGLRRSAAHELGKIKSEKAVEPLIEALNNENVYVRRSAALAFGELKSEKAVEPLIEALHDEDDGVRQRAARALGKLKSEKAVESLIEALHDENYGVRQRAARALGELKSEKAVEPLIEALHDENDGVRRMAAYALGEICTTVHVEILKDLMNSDNAFEANTGFSILRQINKREYSEQELFQEIKKSFKKEQSAQPKKRGCSEARPAEEGMTDPYMKIYVDKLISITEPITMIDYGCGNGKLLCAMKKIPSLKNISYIGIDNKSACRFRARLTAEKYGFFESMRDRPEFLKPQDFFGKELMADYVFMMHTIHELRLADLVDVIFHNSAKLKPGGWIYILDQRILVEKERDFVLWDTEKDFKTLFSDSRFESYWLPMDTGKNHKLCSVAVQKVKNDCFPKYKVAENCRAVYESKKERLLRKRKSEEVNDGSLDSEIANITEQLDEYDKKIQK